MNQTEEYKTLNVEIDVDLQSIIPEFLENRRNDCSLINLYLGEGAFDKIHTLGHRMKGTGGSYGFDDISEIGEVIENASLETDHEKIISAVQRLSDYLDRIAVVYVESE